MFKVRQLHYMEGTPKIMYTCPTLKCTYLVAFNVLALLSFLTYLPSAVHSHFTLAGYLGRERDYSEPAPTSAPSTGCLLLFSCG